MYNPNSMIATEFIDHQEILDTLAYAAENKSNYNLISSLIDRAADCKGLTHREAAVLLECDIPELNEKMYTLAKKIKQQIYGDRIVMFAPLYLSNYCINGCVYCPYHAKNKHIARKKLTQEEIRAEVIA
ncbi:MAG: [Peptococcaceae bacterium]|nr:[FeFe] hydrogenase H-cluster radical SAM maturase HydG [Peptococcaceae bacterium]